jgi:drug/metabolite transporter (DMT)-like permease
MMVERSASGWTMGEQCAPMKPLHLFLLILMNCFWAASYSVFKALSPWLDSGGVTTLRFGIAAMVLLCCWPWLPGAAPRGRDFVRAVFIGITVFVCAPRLQVTGVQLGKAGDASVLLALEPLVVSVGAAIFLRERIGPRRWIGFALGLSGVLLIAQVWKPDFKLPALAANVLVVLSFFCDAAYSIMGKPLLARAGLLKVLGLALASGTIVNLLADGPHIIRSAARLPGQAWWLVIYLSLICTLVGYGLWFVIIREAQVSVVALTVFVQPIVGVGVAVLFLGESLNLGQLWGGLAILAGLLTGLSRQICRFNGRLTGGRPLSESGRSRPCKRRIHSRHFL